MANETIATTDRAVADYIDALASFPNQGEPSDEARNFAHQAVFNLMFDFQRLHEVDPAYQAKQAKVVESIVAMHLLREGQDA